MESSQIIQVQLKACLSLFLCTQNRHMLSGLEVPL